MDAPSEERIRAAEDLLQEAVLQSRERLAAGLALADMAVDVFAAPGRCGLGDPVEGELELTPLGSELLHELWPQPLAPRRLTHLREVVSGWVETSDALDRKRNHFLRDFRSAHGADRTTYSPAETEEFEGGLARINGEASERLRQAALDLLTEA